MRWSSRSKAGIRCALGAGKKKGTYKSVGRGLFQIVTGGESLTQGRLQMLKDRDRKIREATE